MGQILVHYPTIGAVRGMYSGEFLSALAGEGHRNDGAYNALWAG